MKTFLRVERFFRVDRVRGNKKIFYFWSGAISIIEQQHDQTNKMIKCAQQRLQSGLASDQSE